MANSIEHLSKRSDSFAEWLLTDRLRKFFLMSIGIEESADNPAKKDLAINAYRKIILDTLESMSNTGGNIWGKVISHVAEFENMGLDEKLRSKRAALYPQTIQEAKKYFLHKNSDF